MIYLAPSVLEDYTSASEWIQTTSQPFTPHQLCQRIEYELLDQATDFALIQYWGYESLDQWGEVGREATERSFRHLWASRIPSDSDITPPSFRNYIDSEYELRSINQIPPTCVRQILADFRFHLCGVEFHLHDTEILNRYLQFVGSNWVVQAGDYGDERELIVGIGTMRDMDDYVVISIDTELMRTANMIVSLAAAIGDRHIMIRQESLQEIFSIKWCAHISHPYPVSYQLPFRTGLHLKNNTLASYQVKSMSDLAMIKSVFISEMSENILNHELGHGIIQRQKLPRHIAPFSEVTQLIDHPFVHSLLEVLAELAPKLQSIQGPLSHILDVAKFDIIRAERMFWMYASDTFFFDTDDTYMYHYSELVLLIFGAMVTPDGRLDFDGWEYTIWGPGGIYEWTIATVTSTCEHLHSLMESHVFCHDDSSISFVDYRRWLESELTANQTHPISNYVRDATIYGKILGAALTDPSFSHQAVGYLAQESEHYRRTLHARLKIDGDHPVDTMMNRFINYKVSRPI